MRWTNKSFALLGVLLLGGAAQAVTPESLKESYQPIIDRNPFGLRPPPPPPTNNPAENVKPKPKTDIFLTGITSIGYPRLPKQAYFMVREQGKKDPEYYALTEGVEKDGLRVLSIDDVSKKVRVIFENEETLVSFQTHGVAAPASAPAPVAGRPGVPGQPGATQPGFVPPEPGQPNNGGVPAPATMPAIQGNDGGPAPISSSGMRRIPSRQIRGDTGYNADPNFGQQPGMDAGGNPGLQQPQMEEVDPAERYLRMHLNRVAKEQQTGVPMPPLPIIGGQQ